MAIPARRSVFAAMQTLYVHFDVSDTPGEAAGRNAWMLDPDSVPVIPFAKS